MRIALVTGPDPGHAFPVIALATALRDRGHEVVVATGTQWREDLATASLAFAEVPLLAPSEDDTDIGFRVWGRAGQMAPLLADVLAPFAAEVVVADTLTRAGALAAELLGVPWIETSPHFLYDPDPLVPPVGLGAAPAKGPLRRASHAGIRRQQVASVAEGQRLHQQVRRDLGLEGDGDPIGRLFATLPALELPRRRWPVRSFVVGALTWEPPSWPVIDPPPGDAPLVLVSDSTATGIDVSIAEVALTWLRAASDLRGVVTTGNDLDGVDRRVVVARGRHAPLLPHVDLVVGTAGHGLVTKALAAAVPLVLVPLQGDQPETAARVDRAHLGRRVPLADLDAASLDRAVRTVLGDRRIRRHVDAAAFQARRLGPVRAASIVEGLLAGIAGGVS